MEEQIFIPGTEPKMEERTMDPKAIGVDEPKPTIGLRKRGRGRPPLEAGSASMSRPKSKPGEVPELDIRKPAAEVANVHAALDRVLDKEKEFAEYKRELAERYAREFGKKLEVEEPRHMLEGAKAKAPLDDGKCALLAGAIATAPYGFLGLESHPGGTNIAFLAQALKDLSRYYEVDGPALAWLSLSSAALGCAIPAIVELKHRRAGTWETVGRAEAQRAGFVNPEAVFMPGV